MNPLTTDLILTEIESARDEIVDLAARLIRVPTINPPGDAYEAAAHLLGDHLLGNGFDIQYLTASDRPEHSTDHPRVNVLGRLEGRTNHPLLHLNGHLDVVPPGDGWTLDPFSGLIRDGRLYGRGSSDMKAGLAAAVFAVEALKRTGVELTGTIEISGTADEESGGFAGVAWLAEHGYLAAARTDYVIIPEPFGPDRICVGHRGVHWFDLVTTGRTAHGSMPFLGVNAIDQMTVVLEAVRERLLPRLAARHTNLPVVPDLARRATLNLNTIVGGQHDGTGQTPCVPDRCVATFDRRFLPEEPLESVTAEIDQLLREVISAHPELRCERRERMTVAPVRTPEGTPLIGALSEAIKQVTGKRADLVASPGTYDHKHVHRIAGIDQCVAYGPGQLELAHQPDEWCGIDDIVRTTQVLALTIMDLVS